MDTITPSSVCIAIDFETSDYKPDSACAVGLAKIAGGQIVDTYYRVIRPPRKRVYFTHIHGFTWQSLADSPMYVEVWPEIQDFIHGATHFVAHNAAFDKRVLQACCFAANVPTPQAPFICTLKASRRMLQLSSYTLASVCSHFSIPLEHHHAASDAQGAASILLRLLELEQNS